MYRYIKSSESILNSPEQDMDFYHEVKRNKLLDLTWSDGTYFEKGQAHDIIPDKYKPFIQFWKNEVYTGVGAITYKGRVVYVGTDALKVNQTNAQRIVDGIENSYDYSDKMYLFED